MRNYLWLIPAGLLAVGAVGYAADKEPSAKEYGANCAKLEKILVKGRDEEATKKVKAWLYDTLKKGPDGKDMKKKEINLGCSMVLKDKASLEGYKKKADEVAAK